MDHHLRAQTLHSSFKITVPSSSFIQTILSAPESHRIMPLGPRALPPVGEYGVGVYQVSNWLVQTGHNVTTKLYSGYRHEIHNYAEIKNEVEAGIIAFMDKAL